MSSRTSNSEKRYHEPRFGCDFRGVRVHTGARAIGLNSHSLIVIISGFIIGGIIIIREYLTIVDIDRFSKIFIPGNLRGELTAGKYEVIIKDSLVELIPVDSDSGVWDPKIAGYEGARGDPR